MDQELSLHEKEVELSPVKKYFGYEGVDRDDDFEFIAGWSESQQFKTPADMQVALKEIEQRLGTAHISEDRITRIKNYIKARSRLEETWKEIIAMERP